jgi:hypothetical protein
LLSITFSSRAYTRFAVYTARSVHAVCLTSCFDDVLQPLQIAYHPDRHGRLQRPQGSRIARRCRPDVGQITYATGSWLNQTLPRPMTCLFELLVRLPNLKHAINRRDVESCRPCATFFSTPDHYLPPCAAILTGFLGYRLTSGSRASCLSLTLGHLALTSWTADRPVMELACMLAA